MIKGRLSSHVGMIIAGTIVVLASIAGCTNIYKIPADGPVFYKIYTEPPPPPTEPCGGGVGCQLHKPPLQGDVASDGSACTSGVACADTTAHCGTGNAGTCTTIPQGGGKCACGCVYPQ